MVDEATQYDSNGILKIVYHLKDDSIKDGDYFQYFPNGKVSVRATYQMGKMIGPEYFFDRNGDTTKYYTVNKDGQPSFPLAEWLDNGIVLRAEKVTKNSVRWSWFDKSGKLLKQKITFEVPSGFPVPDF